MTEDRNREDRYVVTDHERIRRLAGTEGAEPMSVEHKDGGEDVGLRERPGEPDAERITWDEFFDRFERADRAVQYRPGESGSGSEAVLEVVDRSTRTMPVSDDAGASPHAVDADPIGEDDTREDVADPAARERRAPADRDDPSTADEATEDPADTDTEPLATGDTGDAEPVAFERTESERDGQEDTDHASTASTADTERAPSSHADGLVLDRIHEAQAGLGAGEGSEEFLEFENTGESPIDVSGWTVENGAGRSYRFPSGTVLEPGEGVTLHSEDGEDTEDHLYWGVDEPVWGDKDVTVVVRTETGERVLRERYET